jgi:integrase
MHAARYYYASALLEDGVSIRAVAEYLGHNDPGFTRRVYAHLMPSSERGVDRALGEAMVAGPRALDVPAAPCWC